jgi:TolB protein
LLARRLLPVVALAVIALAPAAAHATSPGVNGPKILFTRCSAGCVTPDTHLLTINPDGTSPTQFLPGSPVALDSSYSPDGTRSAYAYCPTDPNSCVIATNNAAGTDPHPLATLDPNVHDDYPVFSPDGSKIAFFREVASNCDTTCVFTDSLMIMGSGGANPTPLTSDVNPSVVNAEMSFSPDGSKIIFEDAAQGLSVIPSDGSALPAVWDAVSTGEEDSSPDWSPDGSKIVFIHDDGTNLRINAMAASPGATLTPLGADPGPNLDDYEPSYSPDGQKILFELYDKTAFLSPIWVMDSNGANPKRLTDADQFDFRAVWAPQPPAPPAPLPPAFAGVSLLGQSDTVGSNGVAQVSVSCPAGSTGNCAGTLTLKTAGAVAARDAKKKHHKRKKRRVLTLGHAKFSIPAGTTAKVKVKISKTGMTVLRAKKKLTAVANVTSSDNTHVTKTSSTRVTLKLAKQRKHHKKKPHHH